MKSLLNWKVLGALAIAFILTACGGGGGGEGGGGGSTPPATHTISGSVNGVNRDVLMVVTTTDATAYNDWWHHGAFQYVNAMDGHYTITVSAPGCTFSQPSISFVVSGADYDRVNFYGTCV